MQEEIITRLLNKFDLVRYVAIYSNGQLTTRQKSGIENTSTGESDKYEELLVNPVLLKLSTQRGNIDCGGLNYLIIRYGYFYQLIRNLEDGHISICLALKSDINELPDRIFSYLDDNYHNS